MTTAMFYSAERHSGFLRLERETHNSTFSGPTAPSGFRDVYRGLRLYIWSNYTKMHSALAKVEGMVTSSQRV